MLSSPGSRGREQGAFTLEHIAFVIVTMAVLWAVTLVLPSGTLTASATSAATAPRPAPPPPLVAGRPVDDYLTGAVAVPDDFSEVMGYTPVAIKTPYGKRMAAPEGSCSSPMGNAGPYFDFTYPCKTHDLGYDLLRYADRVGPPPNPQARLAVDRRFHRDMYGDCSAPRSGLGTPVCDGWANIYTTVVTGNSIRQAYGIP